MDGLVRAMGYQYMPDGQLFQQTDYSNVGATSIVSQSQDVYNDYGQQTGEYDSPSGAVNTATTPETLTPVNADGEDTSDTDPLGATDGDVYQGGELTQVDQSGHDIPAQYNYDPSTGNLSDSIFIPPAPSAAAPRRRRRGNMTRPAGRC